MTDYRSRVFIGFLAVGLVGVALVNMVVDRHALSEGGRAVAWLESELVAWLDERIAARDA